MSKKQTRHRLIRRRSPLEQMESRIPLAGDIGHNFLMPGDVNNDHVVKASDALAIINALARSAERSEVAPEGEAVDASLAQMFYDVNDDGQISASDALRVINKLAREGESNHADTFLDAESGARARVELEFRSGGLAELEVRISDAPANQSLDFTVGDVVLGQIDTNSEGRGKLELKYGGSRPAIPVVLADATATTSVSIGTAVSGTLGSLGEIESSDGGSDGVSDGHSDASSDSTTDGGSDRSSSSNSSSSQNIGYSGSDSSSSSLSDRSGDDRADGSSDGNSDSPLNLMSDGGSDGESDGGSD